MTDICVSSHPCCWPSWSGLSVDVHSIVRSPFVMLSLSHKQRHDSWVNYPSSSSNQVSLLAFCLSLAFSHTHTHTHTNTHIQGVHHSPQWNPRIDCRQTNTLRLGLFQTEAAPRGFGLRARQLNGCYQPKNKVDWRAECLHCGFLCVCGLMLMVLERVFLYCSAYRRRRENMGIRWYLSNLLLLLLLL